MTLPKTELERVKSKKISKRHIVGLTPKQYILYRINVASGQAIAESTLDFDLDQVELIDAEEGLPYDKIALVRVTPSKSVLWKGSLDYRVPQIRVDKVYGETIDLSMKQVRGYTSYNEMAREHLLPPQVFAEPVLESLEGATLTYRLDFRNTFFAGTTRLRITDVENLITDKPHVDWILGAKEDAVALSAIVNKTVLGGLNLPAYVAPEEPNHEFFEVPD